LKTRDATAQRPARAHDAGGRRAAALAPPACGIDFVDKAARMPGALTVCAPVQPVAQRQVFMKMNGRFYSDLDPSREFNTQQDAANFEAGMQPPDPISQGGRSATFFTYMATKSHRKMSSRGIPQGPHTLGHAATETALFGSQGKIKLEYMIAEQVQTPEQWRDAVRGEFGKGDIFDGKSEQSLRALRAYRAYNGLYQELLRTQTGASTENPYDLVHELMQLAVFTTYKATNPQSVSKKHLKGKGENRDLSDPKNLDPNARFKQQDKYQQMLLDRMNLLDADYVPSEDEDDEDAMEMDDDDE
jgi:hypothetical protein